MKGKAALVLTLFIIWMCRRMYVFSSPDSKSHVSFCLHLEYVVRLSSLYFYKKIFFSENAGPI